MRLDRLRHMYRTHVSTLRDQEQNRIDKASAFDDLLGCRRDLQPQQESGLVNASTAPKSRRREYPWAGSDGRVYAVCSSNVTACHCRSCLAQMRTPSFDCPAGTECSRQSACGFLQSRRFVTHTSPAQCTTVRFLERAFLPPLTCEREAGPAIFGAQICNTPSLNQAARLGGFHKSGHFYSESAG